MQTVSDNDVDFLAFLGKQESQYIRPASEWVDELVNELLGRSDTAGDPLPWPKTHGKVALRPGEVSAWGGYNGHGKSLILSQVCGWSLKARRWLIASMEMPPRKTMRRMVRQVAGTTEVEEDYARRFGTWTNDRLWVYDQTDTVRYDRILGMVHYAAEEIGVDQIVIDSLMKCGFRGSKDQVTAQQIEFVDRLMWAAKSHNIHIHLVHHMRKGERGEYYRPGKHDYRGAGEIIDLVDNAFIIHRNKDKEDKISNGESVNDYDATLELCKQRHGDYEDIWGLYYHPSGQYVEQTGPPMRF